MGLGLGVGLEMGVGVGVGVGEGMVEFSERGSNGVLGRGVTRVGATDGCTGRDAPGGFARLGARGVRGSACSVGMGMEGAGRTRHSGAHWGRWMAGAGRGRGWAVGRRGKRRRGKKCPRSAGAGRGRGRGPRCSEMERGQGACVSGAESNAAEAGVERGAQVAEGTPAVAGADRLEGADEVVDVGRVEGEGRHGGVAVRCQVRARARAHGGATVEELRRRRGRRTVEGTRVAGGGWMGGQDEGRGWRLRLGRAGGHSTDTGTGAADRLSRLRTTGAGARS